MDHLRADSNQDKVHFKNLALAIIDEQHRFGVAQRLALRAKMTVCSSRRVKKVGPAASVMINKAAIGVNKMYHLE